MTIERLHYTLVFFFSLSHTSPFIQVQDANWTGFTKSAPKLTKAISEFKNKQTTEDVMNLKLDLNSKDNISFGKAPSMCWRLTANVQLGSGNVFNSQERSIYKKELLTYKLKLIVTGVDSFNVRGRGKSKKETSRKTWNRCALRLSYLYCCCRFQVRNKTASGRLN